jgi:hypothetical protein
VFYPFGTFARLNQIPTASSSSIPPALPSATLWK